jgi:hypothetical protein
LRLNCCSNMKINIFENSKSGDNKIYAANQ